LININIYSLPQNNILNINISYYFPTHKASLLWHKSRALKIPYIPNRWDLQDIILWTTNARAKSTCVSLYFIITISLHLYYEIITKPFALLTVITLYKLLMIATLKIQLNMTSLILTVKNGNYDTVLI